MKIDVTKEIKGISGDDMREGMNADSIGILNNILTEVERTFQSEFETAEARQKTQEFFERLEKKQLLGRKITLRDLINKALMTGQGTQKSVLKDFRLIQRIEKEDKSDLDYETCKDIFERCHKAYKGWESNVVLLGRLNEAIIEVHPSKVRDAAEQEEEDGEEQ